MVIYSKIGAGLPPHPPPPPNTSAARFASQSDAHVRTDAQIKFLYYLLSHIVLSSVSVVRTNAFIPKFRTILLLFFGVLPFLSPSIK